MAMAVIPPVAVTSTASAIREIGDSCWRVVWHSPTVAKTAISAPIALSARVAASAMLSQGADGSTPYGTSTGNDENILSVLSAQNAGSAVSGGAGHHEAVVL